MTSHLEWQQSPVTADVAKNSSAWWNGETCPFCLIRYQSCRSIKSLYSVTPFSLWLGIFRILVRDWMTSIFMQTLQRLRRPIVRLTFQSGCLYWWWGPLQPKTPLAFSQSLFIGTAATPNCFFWMPSNDVGVHPPMTLSMEVQTTTSTHIRCMSRYKVSSDFPLFVALFPLKFIQLSPYAVRIK